MDKSQTDTMARRFDRISAQEYAPWPVGNWAVEKLTPSGDWVRITPRTSRREADRYVGECQAKCTNCAEMRVI